MTECCMQGLGFRLGPYFKTDELSEEMMTSATAGYANALGTEGGGPTSALSYPPSGGRASSTGLTPAAVVGKQRR
jgi:hypothetical protein